MSKLAFYTDGGCITPQGPSGWGVYVSEKVNGVTKEHRLFGSILKSTNNRAEQQAAIEAIKYAIELSLTSMEIRTDSKYVLKGATEWHKGWIARNWIRADGTDVPNKDLWLELLELQKQFGHTIKWTKVKGHSGIHGNDEADSLASRGNTLAANGIEEVYREISEFSGKSKKTPKAKYNRMISNSRLYFHSKEKAQLSECGRHVYYTGSHGDEESYVGRRSADCIHSVVYLKESDPVLETVRRKHVTIAENELATLAIGRLDTILTGKIYSDILDVKEYTLLSTGRVPGISHVEGALLTYDHTPPIQGFVHLDDMASLEDTLVNYIKRAPGLVITDITDNLYNSSIKGKGKNEHTVYKLRPELGVTVKSFQVPVNIPNGGMQDVIFGLAHTSPSRNTLSALATMTPRVCVVTWPEGKRAFRYAVVIETDDDVGIWTAMHANIKFTK